MHSGRVDRMVTVNGVETSAMVDTGSMQTVIGERLVPPYMRDYTAPFLSHWDEKRYPTAEVYVNVQGESYLI